MMAKQAEAIGKGGQDYMESLSMDRVYDYMFHLVNEYSKLLDFKPARPSSALEVCTDSLLCFADMKQRQILEKSVTHPSPNPPCSLQQANGNILNDWIQKRKKIKRDMEDMNLDNLNF